MPTEGVVISRQIEPTTMGATISGRVWMVRKTALAGELAHEELGEQVADHDLGEDGEEGELQRHPDREEELGVEDEAAEVVGADEERVGVRAERVPLVERRGRGRR